MSLTSQFREVLGEVEAGEHFLPFVGGEAARLERCAIAAKRVFGLPDGSAIDPHAVARSLRVPVVGEPTQFAVLPNDMRQAILASREWSAGTLEGPHGPLIVLNPVHADTRLRVTLAEELSHLVMGHPPSEIDAATGTRTYNATMEQEAFSVGGALVMPYGQLFRLAKFGRSLDEIAAAFSVSTSMARYRINRTGLSRMHRKRAASA
jgi:IrrE N-terminal-like domain